jgi:fructose-bisphosphate aldolase class II
LLERAHELGIGLEGELGHVPRPDASGHVALDELTDPAQAVEYVRATGVDSLAIAIGSIHALKEKTVQLDLKRLEAIRAQVTVPLVLHGSSGVTDDCIATGITLGLCKVNVATQLNLAFTRAVRETLVQMPNEVDPRKYLQAARQAMIERVRERICFLGSAGKAE